MTRGLLVCLGIVACGCLVACSGGDETTTDAGRADGSATQLDGQTRDSSSPTGDSSLADGATADQSPSGDGAAIRDAAEADGSSTACSGAETTSCYTGPEGTEGVGECVAGTKTCVNGEWGPCEDEVLPAEEICNGDDEDCDGTDDNMPTGWVDLSGSGQTCTVDGKLGPCATSTTRACDGGEETCVQTVFPESTDRCGTDSNCDGVANPNGTCPVGQRCSNGGCVTCTQPADTTCPWYNGICIDDAPDITCVCGYVEECVPLSGRCFIRRCIAP